VAAAVAAGYMMIQDDKSFDLPCQGKKAKKLFLVETSKCHQAFSS